MGTCFSLEGGGSKRIAPPQRSQIPNPEDEQVEPTVPSEPPVVIPVPGSRSFVLALVLPEMRHQFLRFFGSAAC